MIGRSGLLQDDGFNLRSRNSHPSKQPSLWVNEIQPRRLASGQRYQLYITVLFMHRLNLKIKIDVPCALGSSVSPANLGSGA